MPISEVYNIDCEKYMAGIPDKFFGLVIVDPPYGILMKARDKPRPVKKAHKHDFRFHEVVKGKGVRFKCACGETMGRDCREAEESTERRQAPGYGRGAGELDEEIGLASLKVVL